MFKAANLPAPKKYRRGKRQCYLCSVRLKLVHATPEETVRQKFIEFLIRTFQTPHDRLSVEESLAHMEIGVKDRVDVLVWDQRSESRKPLILAEIKASHQPITHDTRDQALRYNQWVRARYIVLTNGRRTQWFEAKGEKLREIIEPTVLLGRQHSAKHGPARRLSTRRQLLDNQWVKDHFIDHGHLGTKTPKELWPFAANFRDLLILTNPSWTFPTALRHRFSIVDSFVRHTAQGNASGGSWPGLYRTFLVKDRVGNHQLVGLSVFGSSDKYTAIIVSVEDDVHKHNSLQLSVDRSVHNDGDTGEVVITHNGAMTYGDKGAVKHKVVIDHVSKVRSDLVKDGRIVLGRVPQTCRKLLSWTLCKKLVLNLIDYALIRDDIRRSI
jgi:hypothetical protein